MATIKDFTSNFAKLEKFVGVDFRCRQKKIMFLLTTFSVNYVISSPKPEESQNETLDQARKRSKWENDDFICRGHILNGMQDSLFDIYQYHESAKELRDALENNYMAENASSKKFFVSNFNSYKMVQNRPIIDQFHELQIMHVNLRLYKIEIDEVFLVSSIIDKLPPS
jgi:LTR polyprotein gag-polypeptide-like protein